MSRRLFLLSLGCPKNRVDSEVMAGALLAQGWEMVPGPDDADLLLVNTCSFIGDAKQESVDAILELAEVKASRPGIRLVVAGCMVQQHGREMVPDLPEVDLFIGAAQAGDLPALLDGLGEDGAPRLVSREGGDCFLPEPGAPRYLPDAPHRAYVKISDGCSRTCAFCTIPSIKGPRRDRDPEAVVDEVVRLAAAGVREVTLIGQDISRFQGRDGLPRLLGRLESISELRWVRLLYLYPDGLTEALLDRLGAGGRVLPYVDVPIQHVDDGVLRAMRRATSEAAVRDAVARAQARVPGGALRTTVITGFPGEDEAAFENLLGFVEEGHFRHLGVFAYSPEEGTPAATLPGQVPGAVAAARRDRILEAQRIVSRRWNEADVGRVVDVLVEGPSEEHDWVLTGRTAAQAPQIDGVTYLELCDAAPGEIVACEITEASDYDLVARPLRG
ncbi:MAG: 30S ribosomal protein S12 methylthiotransferase RimO [Pseudomonadota bacterium]